jgi:hypothetical protein
MGGQAYELAPAMHEPIHALRQTHKGIRYLRQTGQFKEYMQVWVDSKTKPFISWDGEGWTDSQGEHRYMLLQSSTGAYIDAPRLSSQECLEFILRIGAENPKTIHVIFGGGYDATHILRDLPLELVAQLKDNNQIFWDCPKTDSTNRNVFKINYLPHKWLEITGFDWVTMKYVHVKIFDVMTYFQSSFIAALNSRQIPVPDVIASGKASRNTFTYNDIDEIKIYCQQELELLVTLCYRLREEFDEAGIYVTQWHGPGAVASAIYKEFGVRKHMREPEPHIERAAQHAYFGGHFEQYKAGHYDGKVYLYDINSAYPYHIANLPSLDGAEWEYTTDYHGQMGMWYCSFDNFDNDYAAAHPLPWRGKGGLVGFPAHNTGVWVWEHEAKYATHVYYGYTLHIKNDEKPFSFVPGMYETRRRWKTEGKGGERAYKLALNSLYGKQAQRVGGQNGNRPSWHQLEWAGKVTSGTRAQILGALQQAGDSVIAVETDSIMTTKPLELDFGDKLGQWETTVFDWVTYIQSGIYFTSDKGATGTKSKTRGIDVKQLHHKEVLAFLDSDQSEPLQINTRQFIGLNNPRTHFYGQWQDSVKDVKVAGAKRIHIKAHCEACTRGESMATNMHTLIAAPYYGLQESLPHPLPWVEGGVMPAEETVYAGDAVQEYDVTRRG